MKPANSFAFFLLALLHLVFLFVPVINTADASSDSTVSGTPVEQTVEKAGNPGLDANPGVAQPNSFSMNETKINNPVKSEPDMELAGFFFIGLLINLMVMAAFFSWAVKQWKKTRK